MCTRRHQYSVDSTISSETTLTSEIFIPNPPWHEVIFSMIEMPFFSFLNALALFRRRCLLHYCCNTFFLNKSISQKKKKKLLYAGLLSSQTLKHVAISGPLKTRVVDLYTETSWRNLCPWSQKWYRASLKIQFKFNSIQFIYLLPGVWSIYRRPERAAKSKVSYTYRYVCKYINSRT